MLVYSRCVGGFQVETFDRRRSLANCTNGGLVSPAQIRLENAIRSYESPNCSPSLICAQFFISTRAHTYSHFPSPISRSLGDLSATIISHTIRHRSHSNAALPNCRQRQRRYTLTHTIELSATNYRRTTCCQFHSTIHSFVAAAGHTRTTGKNGGTEECLKASQTKDYIIRSLLI